MQEQHDTRKKTASILPAGELLTVAKSSALRLTSSLAKRPFQTWTSSPQSSTNELLLSSSLQLSFLPSSIRAHTAGSLPLHLRDRMNRRAKNEDPWILKIGKVKAGVPGAEMLSSSSRFTEAKSDSDALAREMGAKCVFGLHQDFETDCVDSIHKERLLRTRGA